jgi:thiamine pyrophosphokinase
VIELKPEKDITDTYAAIEEGINLGYDEFHLYCCLGGKIEHSLANIQIMAGMAKRGIRIFLHGDETVMVAVNCGSISFGEEAEGMISVFANGTDAEGVSLRGLKYELMNASLSCDFPLGVSNEFLGRESLVSVEKGVLILVISQEAMRWMKR